MKKARVKAFEFALGALLLAFSFSVDAQQLERIPKIGVLVNGTPMTHKFIIDEFSVVCATWAIGRKSM